jgi:RNA polymerase sigma-70 factor (ECF subfamily)
MRQEPFPAGADLERYRNYLRLLARVHLGSRPGPRIDPSDLVQQTLLEAYQKREQFRGAGDAERAGWLRTILARNVADALRAQGRLKRDISRERSLERELAESSARLGSWLAAEGPSPSEFAQRHEQAIRIADALARLPPEQREALVLHYWQGCTLVEVGRALERTPAAAAGLLKRGLKNLREQLGAGE